jgi:acetoin utilization deacetylase AcuC-like enzyme
VIFYNNNLDHRFCDYGIEIPIVSSRSKKCFTFLKNKYPDKIEETDCTHLSPLVREDLLLAHNEEYIDSLLEKNPEDEIIKCFELRDDEGKWNRYNPGKAKKTLLALRDEILLQGMASFKTMEKALEEGFYYFLGGGMHHAMSFGGRGFCLVNDIVIGLRKLQKLKKIKTAWVVDVDAHKGCGTAELTQNDDSIKTLSLHMGKGWPLDSEKYDQNGLLNPWFLESNFDGPIFEGEEDKYNEVLLLGLETLKSFGPGPDLVVIVNGSDPYEKDELLSTSLLNLTLPQLLERDTLLYQWFKERNIPQAYLMSGGYGESSWEVYAQFLSSLLRN